MRFAYIAILAVASGLRVDEAAKAGAASGLRVDEATEAEAAKEVCISRANSDFAFYEWTGRKTGNISGNLLFLDM